MDANVALVVFATGLLGIFAGLCGRILLGVGGGVAAVVGLASLSGNWTGVNPWIALIACGVVGGIATFLLRTARRARRNKAV